MSSTDATPSASAPPSDLLAWIYESECDEFSEELYLYAVAAQNGEPVTARFPALTAHLALCPQCQELYQELQFMLESEARAGLTFGAETSPPPLLTRHTIHQGIDWFLEQTTALVRVWVRGVELLASPSWPTEAIAVRGDAPTGPQEWRLTTGDVDTAPITLGATEVRASLIPHPSDEQRVTWQIEVSQPARWPDFAGITITLYPASGEPQRQTTGHDGIVQFPDLPRQDLAAMQIAIELPV